MVKGYLEKTKQDFYEEKLELSVELSAIQTKYKENLKMIQLLEESNDPNIESFTPREINNYNRNKIIELQYEQKLADKKLQDLRTKISEVDYKIDEINSVIKVAKEDIFDSYDEDFTKQEFDPELNLLLLETVEGERQRISRDLHDSTVQNLTSLVHKSELCMKLLELDPIRCKLELSSISKILRDVIDDTRKMIYDLRPMSFDDIGFEITVERAIDKFKAANNVRCNFKVEGTPYDFKSIIALTLLRVIQESCSNSVKHGNASEINVTLTYNPNEIVVKIEDNGDGFDVSNIPKGTRDDNSGFGLSMMKERVFLLSGRICIDSSIGNGCCIKVNVPIKKEEK